VRKKWRESVGTNWQFAANLGSDCGLNYTIIYLKERVYKTLNLSTILVRGNLLLTNYF